ncbi:hypothetical protein CYMTET_48680 [Cymbomonas tetramitiformis]|uniref:Band 7 domain-containing protein n=1 Tax=Cymbomonas tetramitiformis TaxID=36881 RepID=A0AAE0BTC2_9CHLO|nr:hypothetical protein CYMTET_48680 [Cymbomonas tetramitiformis]|eukprot:gene14943-17662_t
MAASHVGKLQLRFAFHILFYVCAHSFLFQVEEGHVGLYFRGGRLLDTAVGPGLYLHLPYLTRMVNVNVRLQTDVIRKVPCGTKDGIMSEFERVEVVNTLNVEHALRVVKTYGVDYDQIWIHDKVHHEINQFCSNKTLRQVYVDDFATLDELLQLALQSELNEHVKGVQIMAVRMTKPVVPQSIQLNYEAMEEQRTAALVAERTHEVVTQELETERKRLVSAAERKAEEMRIQTDTESQQKRVQAETKAYEQKLAADSERYAVEQQATANQLLLTEEYLRLQETRVWQYNTKAYFGAGIPKFMVDTVQPVPPPDSSELSLK